MIGRIIRSLTGGGGARRGRARAPRRGSRRGAGGGIGSLVRRVLR